MSRGPNRPCPSLCWLKCTFAVFEAAATCRMSNRTASLREAANHRALRARTRQGLVTCQFRAMGSALAWRSSFCWERRSSPPSARRSDAHSRIAVMPADMNVEPGEGQVAESYLLPITPPLEGDSDLCWVYATLSMLETNYMVRHPGSQIALSRGALERDAIADRLLRLIRGEPRNLDNGGLAVEALALIRQNGLLAEDDFYDVLDPDPIQK